MEIAIRRSDTPALASYGVRALLYLRYAADHPDIPGENDQNRVKRRKAAMAISLSCSEEAELEKAHSHTPSCSDLPARRRSSRSVSSAISSIRPDGAAMRGSRASHPHTPRTGRSQADRRRQGSESHQDASVLPLKSSPVKVKVIALSASMSSADSIADLKAHFCA